MTALTQLPAWKALIQHQKHMRKFDMRQAFAADRQRYQSLSLSVDSLLLDYSKNRITAESLHLLTQLAREVGLEDRRAALFAGEAINFTEQRAALHTALRNPSREALLVEGVNVMPLIRDVLDRMRRFTHAVHSGEWRGHTGKQITDIVNIGIGGSDLGPAMVCMALIPAILLSRSRTLILRRLYLLSRPKPLPRSRHWPMRILRVNGSSPIYTMKRRSRDTLSRFPPMHKLYRLSVSITKICSNSGIG